MYSAAALTDDHAQKQDLEITGLIMVTETLAHAGGGESCNKHVKSFRLKVVVICVMQKKILIIFTYGDTGRSTVNG